MIGVLIAGCGNKENNQDKVLVRILEDIQDIVQDDKEAETEVNGDALCDACNGSGEQPCPRCNGVMWEENEKTGVPCLHCGGTGTQICEEYIPFDQIDFHNRTAHSEIYSPECGIYVGTSLEEHNKKSHIE